MVVDLVVEVLHSHPLLTGRGQARVFTLTPQDAQASNGVVAGTLSVCSVEARVLFNPGAPHSFVSPIFASSIVW